MNVSFIKYEREYNSSVCHFQTVDLCYCIIVCTPFVRISVIVIEFIISLYNQSNYTISHSVTVT